MGNLPQRPLDFWAPGRPIPNAVLLVEIVMAVYMFAGGKAFCEDCFCLITLR